MPNEIKTLGDGKILARLETGEVFEGDPIEVTTKLAEAQVNTKRWGQGFKTELDQLKATPPPQPPPPPPTPAEASEAQLQAYLLDQQAKALGYSNGEEFKADLRQVKSTAEQVNNHMVASAFMAQCQDFPNTPESIESLSHKIDEMGWDFTPQSMIAAHALCLRENSADATKGYAPLTVEQQNESWNQGLAEANRQAAQRTAPHPMLRSGSPDANTRGFDPWSKDVKLEDLRAMAIRQQLEGRQ